MLLGFACLVLGVTPSDSQGLLLALQSGIIPVGALGTIWHAGDWIQLPGCKASTLPAVLSF